MSNSSRNGAATAGLVLGIISLVAWLIPLISLPVCIIGLIQSIRGVKSQNRAAANGGIVMNIIGMVATIVHATLIAVSLI